MKEGLTRCNFMLLTQEARKSEWKVKGELQRQNKLISSEVPFKILQNETKSLKSAKPFSRYSTLKIKIWTILREKKTEKPKMLFFSEVLHKLKNNRLCDVRNDKYTIQQQTVSDVPVCRPDTKIQFYG